MRHRAPTCCLLVLAIISLSGLSTRADDEADRAAADVRLLKESGLSCERNVLVRFFRLRALTDADRAALPKLISQLGSDAFDDREAAQAALLAHGPSIRAVLEKNRAHADAEVGRRCRELLDRLDRGPGADLTTAAVRQLTRAPADEVVPILLDYLPFAEDPSVVEETLAGLARTAKTAGRDALRKALAGEPVERRAAAAFALGPTEPELVRPLLEDDAVAVRYRAAQGLLAAKEPKAVVALIDPIPTAPPPVLAGVEATLAHLADESLPSSGTGSDADRKRSRDAWAAWWQANEGRVDLTRATRAFGGPAGLRTTKSGLKLQDLKLGTGAEARPGSNVRVHYVGTLADGKKFDSSRDRGQPFDFALGSGMVIKGWDEGVTGMKVGGKRKLVIPPELGYGARGVPPTVPPNATMIFEVELLSIAK